MIGLMAIVAAIAMPATLHSIGCHPRIVDQAAPVTVGPYQLANAYCPPPLDSSYTISAPSISPDGRRYFVSGYGSLWIGSIGSATEPHEIATSITISGFGYSQKPPFAWASNSREILGVSQDAMQPSGHALGPLWAIRISIEGEAQTLPPLTSSAGRFDGVLWVGGDGLALAEFGTKGSYYRPEHDDPTPTLAIVDGRHGKVLQAVPMPLSHGEKPAIRVGDIDVRIDRRGKIYALFVLKGGRWFEWRQGKPPRETLLRPGPNGSWKFAISPDLKTVLIVHGLSASGMICEYIANNPPRPECAERTPHSGPIADLWDIGTGLKLWSITGTATNFSQTYQPVISRDGRHALISMPPEKNSPRETIALISMTDGHEIQRFNKPEAFDFALRFGRDGRSFSIDDAMAILTYRLGENRPASSSSE